MEGHSIIQGITLPEPQLFQASCTLVSRSAMTGSVLYYLPHFSMGEGNVKVLSSEVSEYSEISKPQMIAGYITIQME